MARQPLIHTTAALVVVGRKCNERIKIAAATKSVLIAAWPGMAEEPMAQGHPVSMRLLAMASKYQPVIPAKAGIHLA